MDKISIGIDFGSDSVRALAVDVHTGEELTSSVMDYPRWKKQLYCDAKISQFRQHPLDHIEVLEHILKDVSAQLGLRAKDVIGIGVDTTGSSPMAIGKDGQSLAFQKGFEENPNAMCILWKDHTSVKEAAEINKLCNTSPDKNYTKYIGGVYSSEWFWAKILHTLRGDEQVREHAHTWAEHCDWVTSVLTDNYDVKSWKRSRCAAGHKAMWHESWDGLPPEEFLVELDPLLKGLRARLYNQTYTSNEEFGKLSQKWAKKTGLPEGISVAVGAFDAHLGAVGAGAEPYSFVRVMGTSTCDIMTAPKEQVKDLCVAGICGQVDGSVVENLIGFEAGQSSFGDCFAWFEKLVSWPIMHNDILSQEQKIELKKSILPNLSAEAEKMPPGAGMDIVALDWLNGRRTPYADQRVKSMISGLYLAVDAPHIYRALLEAAAFGARAIVERFLNDNIPIKEVVGIGGVSLKSPLLMQILADVLNMPIKVKASSQCCALGAALAGATASGYFASTEEAMQKIASADLKIYQPIAENIQTYNRLYAKYLQLADFENNNVEENPHGN
ncbi:MAG: ribulokinase [Alphaproteobacteria bacterium]